jgi:hypothetical protein
MPRKSGRLDGVAGSIVEYVILFVFGSANILRDSFNLRVFVY